MSAAVFVSPRTSSEPMAFTIQEFIRGTAFAWIIFVLGAELAYAVDAATPVPGLVYESFNGLTGEALFWSRVGNSFLFIAPFSFVLACVLAPLGLGVGNGLRRTDNVYVHSAMFLILGAGIGLAWWVLCRFLWVDPMRPFAIGVAIAVALALPTGWNITARIALRRDARHRSLVDAGSIGFVR